MLATITINGVDYTCVLYVIAAAHLFFTLGYMIGLWDATKAESEAKDE